jgi:regulation of enolase protein 1 (concanavalin A-like superfamily)
MSEFKFACPVCGQHMACDSSQSGTVMECPTCFQKITAPQAPAAGNDQKFVLTGTKVGERPMPKLAAENPGAVPSAKSFPWGILILVMVVGVAGAGVFALRGKLFHAAWQTGDIGNVGAAGSFSLADGVFTVSGSGADIWNQADSFRYVFQAVDGGCTLTARVLNIKNTDAWAKAGLMIRESPDPNSTYAAVLVTSSSGIAFQQRGRTTVPASSVLIVPNQAAPRWFRLVRRENTFTAYSSVNGTSWTTMGSTTIPMGSRMYAGLCVCSHSYGTLCQAQFDNVDFNLTLNPGK